MLNFIPHLKKRSPHLPRALPASLSQFLLLALLSRARLLGELSPFAPACFAAALLSRRAHPVYMLAGCALGALSGGLSVPALLPFLSCLIVYALFSLRRLLCRAPCAAPPGDAFCALSAFLSLLLPGLLFSGGLAYNLITASLGALAAGMLAPALTGALGIRLSRRLLMPDEQLSLALLSLLCLIAAGALPRIGSFAAQAAAVFLTLVCSFSGCGMGALGGIAAGSALALGGSDPFIGSSLCLCGVLAGCMKDTPRPVACTLFFFGSLLTITWGLGYTLGVIDPAPLLTGCALYCLIPRALLHRVRKWMTPRLPHADPERLALRVRRRAGRRMAEISAVFGELADGYGEKVVLPGEKQLISRLRGALCKDCTGYEECWKGAHAHAGRMLCRMAAQALTAGDVTPASALPPDLLRHCRRSSQIDRRITPLLKRLCEERRALLKRGEARSLMAHQFREAQKILDALSTRLSSEICLNEEFALLARAALDRAGMGCREVLAILDDRLEIVCLLKEGTWSTRRAREAARLLSAETGLPFSPVLSHGRVPGECELYLMQSPALSARFAAAALPMEDGAPCGDSHIIQLLPDGRLLAAISDGMGSGEQAACESARCISLLRKFVTAGVDRDASLTAVNQLLMMRGGEEMFATADLCVINLYSGIASFSKLGACRSFLLQEKSIRQIAGGRLPLGILDRVEPASFRTEVYPGDLLIMISDGVADELREGEADRIKAILPSLRALSPADAAERVLQCAAERDGASRRDDMTVLAVRIEEKCERFASA